MKSDLLPVAIVGGGFSGTALAAELTRRGVPVILIEGGGRAGLGAAYSTKESEHVLNVRAEVMSARADDPDDFVRAVEATGGTRKDFAQRRHYGAYLRTVLDEALAAGAALISESALGATSTAAGWEIGLANGDTVAASALVLAIGNQPPEPPREFSGAGKRFINNPWSDAARAAERAAAASGEDVLLLGTGLTMVDAALLLDSAGHQGRVVALSRRGLIPRGHVEQPAPPAPVALHELPAGNVLAIWRWLRKRAAAVDWRAATDSLRPHSQALWQSLGKDQQRRFMRHARPWWDVHRHRIAPEVARRIKAMIAEGRLEIAAGRVREARAVAGGIEVAIARRGSDRTETRTFCHVFNCTGPLGAIALTRSELLKQMLADGLVRPDPLGIALDVDGRSRPVGSERLWALGPMTKGRYWEIIAVPDIRVQAATVAADIAKELGQ
jgi:uncharacterized NAD(P)/FAD-binding protein YdhS